MYRIQPAALALGSSSCSDHQESKLAEEQSWNSLRSTSTGEVISVDRDDAEMTAAIRKARETFPMFWKDMSEDRLLVKRKVSLAMVKAYFPHERDPDGGEHLWLDEIRYDGKEISGVVSSEPLNLSEPKLGDTVSFPLSQLSDWMIVEDDIARGAYTVQLLRSRLSAEDRAEHDSHYDWAFPEL